jgi:hypothetical protein
VFNSSGRSSSGTRWKIAAITAFAAPARNIREGGREGGREKQRREEGKKGRGEDGRAERRERRGKEGRGEREEERKVARHRRVAYLGIMLSARER